MNRNRELANLANAVEKDQTILTGEKSRRVWLQNLGLISATGLVMWACGKKSDDDVAVAATIDYKKDADTLNGALALEHEAIGIYTRAAGAAIWTGTGTEATVKPALLAVAGSFLAHHKAHRDALIAKINGIKDKSAVEPVAAQADTVYLPDATLTIVAGLPNPVAGVVQFAAVKELAAAKAYANAIKAFTDPELGYTSGLLAGDEAAHFGILRGAMFLLGVFDAEGLYNFAGADAITATTILNSAFISDATTKNPLA